MYLFAIHIYSLVKGLFNSLVNFWKVVCLLIDHKSVPIYGSSIKYVFCKYFLQACGLSFDFLNSTFQKSSF